MQGRRRHWCGGVGCRVGSRVNKIACRRRRVDKKEHGKMWRDFTDTSRVSYSYTVNPSSKEFIVIYVIMSMGN